MSHTDKPRKNESLTDYQSRMFPLFQKAFQRNSESQLKKVIKKQYQKDVYHVSMGEKRITLPITKPTPQKTLAEKEASLGLKKRHTINRKKRGDE